MSYRDYEMKCVELEEALRLSDIRKEQLEQHIKKQDKEIKKLQDWVSGLEGIDNLFEKDK